MRLQYNFTGDHFVGYYDSDWANYLDDRHSTTGNVFVMSGGAVSWLSQKQATVALFTAEAEYVALGSATQEAIWLQQLLLDLGANPEAPINIFEDNQSAIAMVKNPVGHKRTKHIDIKYHFIQETMQAKLSMYLTVRRKNCLQISSPSHCQEHSLNKLIFLYLKTRCCKYYTLNIIIMYIKLHKLSWIRNYICTKIHENLMNKHTLWYKLLLTTQLSRDIPYN